MAGLERHVYDRTSGLPANVGFYQCKPATYLDLPDKLDWDAVDLPDRDNPVGAKGIGEPVMAVPRLQSYAQFLMRLVVTCLTAYPLRPI